MTGRSVDGWGFGDGWVLRLVETGIDDPARVIDGLNIRPLGGLGEIAKLGLTLAEAEQILARLQETVVAVQADDHAVLRLCALRCRSIEPYSPRKTDMPPAPASMLRQLIALMVDSSVPVMRAL
jgi:hypothetical protein